MVGVPVLMLHTLKYEFTRLADLFELCIVLDSYDILKFEFEQAVVDVLRRPLCYSSVFEVVLELHHVKFCKTSAGG